MTEFDTVQTKELNVARNFIVAGRTGRPAYFEALVNAKMGGWFNASKSYVDLMTSGSVTGLISAHNMELRLANSHIAWGAYTCAEHNLVLQASTSWAAAGYTNFGWYRISGDAAAIAAWEDLSKSAFFHIEGLSAGAGSVFDTTGGATVKATLKIIIGTTPYYIMLATAPNS